MVLFIRWTLPWTQGFDPSKNAFMAPCDTHAFFKKYCFVSCPKSVDRFQFNAKMLQIYCFLINRAAKLNWYTEVTDNK